MLTKLTKEQKLAELIHEKICRCNHTSDQCSWYYESWERNGYKHKKYLNIAKKILEQVSYDDAILVIGSL